jgi:predicted RecA/RadA family phage recombinase
MEFEGARTYLAGGTVYAYRLVKTPTGVVHNTATSTDDPIGVAQNDADSGENVTVKHLGDGGTLEMTAAGVITAGAVVYAAANGKIQALPEASATYRKIGIALEAADADGDIIEVLPYAFSDTTTV